MLFVDLDNFRRMNDVLGHVVGDDLLRRVAQRLREILRRDDEIAGPSVQPATGFEVARLGGDQFVILFHSIRDAQDAATVAARLTRPLMTAADHECLPVTLTASVGIAVHSGEGASVEALLRQSGIAMYSAKRHGRGEFAFFDSAMNEGAEVRFSLEADSRERSRETNSRCTTSLSSTSRPAGSPAWRRSCAGRIPSSAAYRPTSSFRWRRRPA